MVEASFCSWALLEVFGSAFGYYCLQKRDIVFQVLCFSLERTSRALVPVFALRETVNANCNV